MTTLQRSLEEVARMRPTYLLNEAGYEWSAGALLQWLQREDSRLLAVPVYLLRPRVGGTGAIYAVDAAGELLSTVPLYVIERHPPPMSAPGAASRLRREASGEALPLEAVPSW
jgi:hypothetical protein